MLRIRPSKKTVVVFIGIATVLFVACGLLCQNRVAKLYKLRGEIEAKRLKLAESERIASRLTETEQDYLDACETLSILEKGVSTEAYVPTLLRQIEVLGKKVNLRVVGVRPRVPERVANTAPTPGEEKSGEKKQAPSVQKPEPYDKLNIELEVQGKYWDVVRFLKEITNFPKLIAVDEMEISPVGEAKSMSSPPLQVKMRTTAFILKKVSPAARNYRCPGNMPVKSI